MELTLIAIRTAIVLSISTTLAIIAVGLRLWSRKLMGTPLAFNDYMVIIATILALGVYSNAMIEVFTGGIGHHVKDIMEKDPNLITLYLKSFTAAQLLWAASNTCVKFSILSLYMIIFPGPRFAHCCRGLMAITIVYFISVVAESFALCHPVEFNWYKTIPGAWCENQGLSYLIAGITNLVIDASIVILPMPMLFSLRLTLLKRFGVAGMFSLGAVICVLSLLRVLWLISWDVSDLTYGVGLGTIYSTLEPTLGIVNSCLPVIKPSLKRIFAANSGDWTKKVLKRSTATGSQDTSTPPAIGPLSHGFERLDDSIPLANVRAHTRTNNTSRWDNTEDINNILITREWEVNRSVLGRGEGLSYGL
ncbi:uncharacterized protein F4807DRAFT_196098 [Annulohypoxylon truncatum]|uniref:uncharacterized protein n=1 Tax=Annulohypoxylon truncatum TaxID=327061 RepID=UPI0020072E5C|nr:uncharacterized protein F4807DRAFT_196098 [Annulohypoxylon truncatum]KAI1213679.1 hypothetical protein F4807DRAFT_196098 [Annulohypoxylon truncatum]